MRQQGAGIKAGGDQGEGDGRVALGPIGQGVGERVAIRVAGLPGEGGGEGHIHRAIQRGEGLRRQRDIVEGGEAPHRAGGLGQAIAGGDRPIVNRVRQQGAGAEGRLGEGRGEQGRGIGGAKIQVVGDWITVQVRAGGPGEGHILRLVAGAIQRGEQGRFLWGGILDGQAGGAGQHAGHAIVNEDLVGHLQGGRQAQVGADGVGDGDHLARVKRALPGDRASGISGQALGGGQVAGPGQLGGQAVGEGGAAGAGAGQGAVLEAHLVREQVAGQGLAGRDLLGGGAQVGRGHGFQGKILHLALVHDDQALLGVMIGGRGAQGVGAGADANRILAAAGVALGMDGRIQEFQGGLQGQAAVGLGDDAGDDPGLGGAEVEILHGGQAGGDGDSGRLGQVAGHADSQGVAAIQDDAVVVAGIGVGAGKNGDGRAAAADADAGVERRAVAGIQHLAVQAGEGLRQPPEHGLLVVIPIGVHLLERRVFDARDLDGNVMLAAPVIGPILHAAPDLVPFPAAGHALGETAAPDHGVEDGVAGAKIVIQLVIGGVVGDDGVAGGGDGIPGVVEHQRAAVVVGAHGEAVCIAQEHVGLGLGLAAGGVVHRVGEAVGEVPVQIFAVGIPAAAGDVAIGVVDGAEPDLDVIYQAGQGGVGAVAVRQQLGQAHGHLGAGGLVAVHGAGIFELRLVLFQGGVVGDLEAVHQAALHGSADLYQVNQAGVGGFEVLHAGDELGIGGPGIWRAGAGAVGKVVAQALVGDGGGGQAGLGQFGGLGGVDVDGGYGRGQRVRRRLDALQVDPQAVEGLQVGGRAEGYHRGVAVREGVRLGRGGLAGGGSQGRDGDDEGGGEEDGEEEFEGGGHEEDYIACERYQ